MVNSKKSSKSLIALVVMALLLVASIVLAATGAWFTDKVSDNDNGTFGTIELGALEVTVEDQIMPGDTIAMGEVAYDGSADAYYKVTVAITGAGADAINAINPVYGIVAAGDDAKIDIADITIPGEETTNDYQGLAVTVTVTVEVIQVDNIEVTGDTDAAKAESAFAGKTIVEKGE